MTDLILKQRQQDILKGCDNLLERYNVLAGKMKIPSVNPGYMLVIEKDGKIVNRIYVRGDFDRMKDLKICEQSISNYSKYYKTNNTLMDFIIYRERDFIDEYRNKMIDVDPNVNKITFISFLKKVYEFSLMSCVDLNNTPGDFWIESMFNSQSIDWPEHGSFSDYSNFIYKTYKEIEKEYISNEPIFQRYRELEKKFEKLSLQLPTEKDKKKYEKLIEEMKPELLECKKITLKWTTLYGKSRAAVYLVSIANIEEL